MDRRSLLKGLAVAGAATALPTGDASARTTSAEAPVDAVGLLYDASRCIGCKACSVACKEANELPPVSSDGTPALYDAPVDLDGDTKSVIKLYREGETVSYVKSQCMHCIDPACATACMLGALQKGEKGIVTWDGSKCVGCRYCQMACPFNVPRFQWTARNPKIVKCELCNDRLAKGQKPACTTVCPRDAVTFGTRAELLAEAKARIAARPDVYVPKVYGETDGGGTQVLYISHVPFEKLGLPTLGDRPSAETARTVQHTVYKGFIAPVALYAVIGAVLLRNRRHPDEGAEAEEDRP